METEVEKLTKLIDTELDNIELLNKQIEYLESAKKKSSNEARKYLEKLKAALKIEREAT